MKEFAGFLRRSFYQVNCGVLLIAVLAGCSSVQPYSPATFDKYQEEEKEKNVNACITDNEEPWLSLCKANHFAHYRAGEYLNQSKQIWKDGTFYDSMLIGLASAVAGGMLYHANNDLLSGLGLGAGTFTAMRTYGNSKNQSLIFYQAVAAALCVYDNGNKLYERRAAFMTAVEHSDLYPKERMTSLKELHDKLSDESKAKEPLGAAIKLYTDAKASLDAANDIVENEPEHIKATLTKIDLNVDRLRQQGIPDVAGITHLIKETADNIVSTQGKNTAITRQGDGINATVAGVKVKTRKFARARNLGEDDETKALREASLLVTAAKEISDASSAIMTARDSISACEANIK